MNGKRHAAYAVLSFLKSAVGSGTKRSSNSILTSCCEKLQVEKAVFLIKQWI